MIVAPDTTALRHHIRGLKDAPRRIAFVPTMGNLHAGHLALVTQAQAVRRGCRINLCQSDAIRRT